MIRRHVKTWLQYIQRMVTCVVVLCCVLPASDVEAATNSLGDALWANTGFCVADTTRESTVEVMTPDARAYQMSIELRALRDMVRVQQSSRTPIQSSPCDDTQEDDQAPALCVVDTEVEEAPHFVAASLLEDIAPLEPTQEPRRSCNATSSGPDQCESYPAHPQRLHIDVSYASALVKHTAHTLTSPRQTSRTLPLVRALPQHLLGAASGHTLDDERPPQHA